MTRKPGFDLAAELAKPSFTPGARDAPALVELVMGTDEAVAARAAPALASLKAVGRAAVTARLDGETSRATVPSDAGGRARLVGVLGLLARAGDREARTMLLVALRDDEVRVRRAAASALGKLEVKDGDAAGAEVRAGLLARWDAGDVTADERRVLVEALGKIGGAQALARLHALDASGDAELARRRDRAVLMADRSAKRDEDSAIVVDVAPPMPVIVRLGCKAGLAELLVEELRSIGVAAKALVDREVELSLSAPLSTLFASRLWATLAVRVPIDHTRTPRGSLATALTRAITAPAARELLRAWTRGPIRWRLGFATGHKRSVVWHVARDVTAAAPELVNDPQATTWDILVEDATTASHDAPPADRAGASTTHGDAGSLLLVPRRLDDPRFAWRVADVPAASHPSVAAALVWVAGPREGDRVWDPFCGSGLELIERALVRGRPCARLIGTDIDDAALVAARANADAAKVGIEFAQGDARRYDAGPFDLVITNPPLGSRVQGDAVALLAESLPRLVAQLAPKGRLVWITPATKRTTPTCERLGLRRARWFHVDLGGVRGHLERWEKP